MIQGKLSFLDNKLTGIFWEKNLPRCRLGSSDMVLGWRLRGKRLARSLCWGEVFQTHYLIDCFLF